MALTGDNTKFKTMDHAAKPGRHNPPKAAPARHDMAPIADSAWSDRSFSDTLSSQQAASKIPPEATSSDNSYAKALIATDTSAQCRKPSIFK
jgi:hypothetical protein